MVPNVGEPVVVYTGNENNPNIVTEGRDDIRHAISGEEYWIDFASYKGFVWMRVVFAPEVEEDLYGLIKILVEKEYLGTYPFAISYVED